MSELRRLGEIINPALAKLETSDQARAYGLWARAVGDPIAANARPRHFARGLLTLECSSSIWANELTYLAPQILTRMAELEPSNPVQKLRFATARGLFAPPTAASPGSPAEQAETASATNTQEREQPLPGAAGQWPAGGADVNQK